MRFIVLGAGAVGGVVGGRLFEHGHDVVLVAGWRARGPRESRAASRRNGEQLERPPVVRLDEMPAAADELELGLA